MWESRWLRSIGPPVVALVGRRRAIASATARAGPHVGPARLSGRGARPRAAAARTARPRDGELAARRGTASTRSSDPMARSTGSACRSGSSATRSCGPWRLPAESFAAGPFGGADPRRLR